MTKKKSIVSKLLLLVLLLTLVSCCFLGSTFARYTSGGKGSATVSVAKWEITEGDGSIKFDVTNKLSPNMDTYEGTPRTSTTGKILVATIRNTGDVDALVTLTKGELQFASNAAYGQGVATDGGIPTADEIKEVFSITLYTNTTYDKGTATEYTQECEVAAKTGVLYVYAEVVWTSDTAKITGDNADKRDTYIGKYITEISYELSYTAVQNSENPAIA